MGTEAAWVPLLIAATGAGASYVNTTRTAKRQDQVLAEGIRQKSRTQQGADAKVNELIAKTGDSNAEADKGQALQQYMATLKQSRGQAVGGLAPMSGASEAYAADANQAALGIDDYGSKIAGLMSRIDGPAAQRRREGNDQADFGVAIDQIKRFAEGDDFINRMKLNGVRRNPLLDAFASFAQGTASGMAGAPSGSAGIGVPAQGSGSWLGSGYGSTWGSGRGLAAAGF